MAGQIEMGGTGATVAANVRRLRTDARMTYVELATKLVEHGRRIPVLGLRRIEAQERRVDADDLVALAAALGSTPLDLLGLTSAAGDPAAGQTGGHWRVGAHYEIHVYEGDRPVATFLRAKDAAEAVRHVNFVRSCDAAFEADASLNDATPIVAEAEKAAAVEEQRHAISGRVRKARLAGRLQALREAQAELRRLAAEAGITVDTTTKEN